MHQASSRTETKSDPRSGLTTLAVIVLFGMAHDMSALTDAKPVSSERRISIGLVISGQILTELSKDTFSMPVSGLAYLLVPRGFDCILLNVHSILYTFTFLHNV